MIGLILWMIMNALLVMFSPMAQVLLLIVRAGKRLWLCRPPKLSMLLYSSLPGGLAKKTTSWLWWSSRRWNKHSVTTGLLLLWQLKNTHPALQSWTKHIDIWHHFVHSLTSEEKIKLISWSTVALMIKLQIYFSKSLFEAKHDKFWLRLEHWCKGGW